MLRQLMTHSALSKEISTGGSQGQMSVVALVCFLVQIWMENSDLCRTGKVTLQIKVDGDEMTRRYYGIDA